MLTDNKSRHTFSMQILNMESNSLQQFMLSLLIGFISSVIYLHTGEYGREKFSDLMNILFENDVSVESRVISEKEKLSRALHSQVRLLCLITTSTHRVSHQKAILDTWAARCDTTLFIMGRVRNGSEKNLGRRSCIYFQVENLTSNIKKIYFDMVDVYANLWQKTKLAFQYIVDEESFDWVLKVDDDSYVLTENLRLFIMDRNMNQSSFYGFHYKPQAPKGFNSGGPGYIMSHFVANKFVQLLRGALNSSVCPRAIDNGPEDVYVANCLADLGIYPADTRDNMNRFRFMPIQVEAAISGSNIPGWFWDLLLYPFKQGLECCSDAAISFHYVSPENMRLMDYLSQCSHPFSSRTIWRKEDRNLSTNVDKYFKSKNNTDNMLQKKEGCVAIGV